MNKIFEFRDVKRTSPLKLRHLPTRVGLILHCDTDLTLNLQVTSRSALPSQKALLGWTDRVG